MTTAEVDAPRCAVGPPTSRRFYVHERSFGALLAAQPSSRKELTQALVLAAASRGAEQFVEDTELFGGPLLHPSVRAAVQDLHELAATKLVQAFRTLVHIVPADYGSVATLLGNHEGITAWCYESGYFTYATDDDAAKVMYAEAGSLHELRSRIRRSPDFDPSLQMISGQSLFHFDARAGQSASWYRKQYRRLLHRAEAKGSDLRYEQVDANGDIEEMFTGVTDGAAVADMTVRCRRNAAMTLEVLRRSRTAVV